jgi:hypothetical protein
MGDTRIEICAYCTAVVAIQVTDAAMQTAIQLGYGEPGRITGSGWAAAF